jgi:hypothetical protein
MTSSSGVNERRWLLLSREVRDRATSVMELPDEKRVAFLRTTREEMLDLARALEISREECLKLCQECFGEDFPKV